MPSCLLRCLGSISVLGVALLAGCKDNGVPVTKASVSVKESSKGVRVVQQTVSDDGLDHALVLAVDKPADEERFTLVMGTELIGPNIKDSSSAEVAFIFKDGRLRVEPDWQSAGGGERPAFRREGDRQITAYYPVRLKTARTWAKYLISVQ